jgi:RNA polymerase sigma-70 factor (ECF subfamily)
LPKKYYQEEDAFTALRNGEEKGLDYFFNSYYSPLLFFSTSITNSQQAAEDIVLETFVKLWRLRTEISEWKSVRFTLYRIVRNASIDYTRSRKRFKQAVQGAGSYTSTYETGALDKLAETETYHRLYLVISSLPLKCRQVFQMFYFEDMSIKQIAKKLDISTNTVKSHKQKALQLLKKKQSTLLRIVLIVSMWAFV